MTEPADSGSPPLPSRAEQIVDELEERVVDVAALQDAEPTESAPDATKAVPGDPEPPD